jgi:uncharacterized protein YceH (UPF0502 family)
LYQFDDLDAVESTLHRLAEMEMTVQLPRQPGFKEQRWAQLLTGPVDVSAPVAEAIEAAAPDRRDRIAALEEEVAQLRREFEEFRRRFE